jgi:hypothetical protein
MSVYVLAKSNKKTSTDMHGDSLLLDETFQDGRMMHAMVSRSICEAHTTFLCVYIYGVIVNVRDHCFIILATKDRRQL